MSRRRSACGGEAPTPLIGDAPADVMRDADAAGPEVVAPDLAELRARQQAVIADLGVRALAGMPTAALLQEAAERVATAPSTEFVKVVQLLPDDRLHALSQASAGSRA